MKGKLVYLGLGTNLGDKYQNLLTAIRLISKIEHTCVIAMSSIYESASWGFVSHNFFNMVISVKTYQTPEKLLAKVQKIEFEMGRTKKTIDKKYQERLIDIDILIFQDEKRNSQNLVLPHPEIPNRNFVLYPLFELDKSIILNHNTLEETISLHKESSCIKRLQEETTLLLNENLLSNS